MQHILPFDGGDIKMTTATYWRPSKKNINKASTPGKDDDVWGVMPDTLIKLSAQQRNDLEEHLHASEIIPRKNKPAQVKEFKDKQLDAALDYLRGQIQTAGRVPAKKAG